MQLGADEAQPLLQAGPLNSRARRQLGIGEAVGDILQDRGILGEQRAVVHADRRHHPERVDFEIVGAVVHDSFGLGVDFDEAGVGAGLVE